MTGPDAVRRVLFAWALAIAVTACATESIQPGTPREVTGFRINPFELHEECMRMAPGDRLVYRFTAQRPVAFNIHYHEGKTVIMPVSRDDTTAEDDTFRPLAAHDYCLMCEAGREGAIVDYRILLSRGPR
jgi:hypothetical protein